MSEPEQPPRTTPAPEQSPPETPPPPGPIRSARNEVRHNIHAAHNEVRQNLHAAREEVRRNLRSAGEDVYGTLRSTWEELQRRDDGTLPGPDQPEAPDGPRPPRHQQRWGRGEGPLPIPPQLPPQIAGMVEEGRRHSVAFVRDHWIDILMVPFQRQTYLNIAYFLFMEVWIGVLYFVVLLVGIILGIGLIPVFIGFPILFAMMMVVARFGAWERAIAGIMLGVKIPPPIRPDLPTQSWWRRFTTSLRDEVTWTNLLYLMLKLPLGALTLVVTVTLLSWTVGAAFNIPRWFVVFGPPSVPYVLLQLVQAVIYGYISLHVINGMAALWRRYARRMLGPSDAAVRIAATERIATQERAKAERADQSRRELIVNVSHELRTPTASIRGHVESLMMALEPGTGAAGEPQGPRLGPAQVKSYLGIIHRETERLATLVDDLLTLARSESDELRLAIAPIAAAGVVHEVHETLAPLAWNQRSVTLVQDIQPDLPLVWGDHQRLLQVVLNLVRNAITHTPTGGLVSIGLARSGPDHLALVVADTGAGIPPDDLDQIFDRFYRVDASRTRASGGFGLGLTIVKELVTAMGGTVSVTSKVGEGSAFQVTLRVAHPGSSPPEHGTTPEPGEGIG